METAGIRISGRKLKSLVTDTVKSAAAANLIYVSDIQPGITRIRRNEGFIYKQAGKTISDKNTLARIRSLVIPPAWEKVWICNEANGHLQVTGFDVRGRKQYKYHPLWNTLRNHTKFFHLLDFGKTLPAIRAQLYKDLNVTGLPLKKVLAAVVLVMQDTSIRIGNNNYEKLYGSFGLTTLKDQHVKISGSNAVFSFKGKKGVYQNITMKSRKLSKIVKQCRDIPGKELFQYYDDEGKRHAIDSGMVNNYIRDISGGNFTAKDFRTWAGSVYALKALKELGCCDGITETKKRVVAALDVVAKQLGNTRTVCKKYYVHPLLLTLYESSKLEKYFNQLEKLVCNDANRELKTEEQLLLKILETESSAVALAS